DGTTSLLGIHVDEGGNHHHLPWRYRRDDNRPSRLFPPRAPRHAVAGHGGVAGGGRIRAEQHAPAVVPVNSGGPIATCARRIRRCGGFGVGAAHVLISRQAASSLLAAIAPTSFALLRIRRHALPRPSWPAPPRCSGPPCAGSER